MPSDIGGALVGLLPRLRRFARGLCRSTELADDLVQEACERALATTSGPAPGTPFEAWMFRILRNLWIDRLRRQKTAGLSVDLDEHDELAAPDGVAQTEARLTLERVRRAIERLPDEQREVVLLVCVEELSYRDAAAALDLPVGTVMSRLARARVRLAQLTQGAGKAPAPPAAPEELQ